MAEVDDKVYLDGDEDEVIGAPSFDRDSYGETSTSEANQDFFGRLVLKNYTSAPKSGRIGEIAMIDGELHQWDSSSSSWKKFSVV